MMVPERNFQPLATLDNLLDFSISNFGAHIPPISRHNRLTLAEYLATRLEHRFQPALTLEVGLAPLQIEPSMSRISAQTQPAPVSVPKQKSKIQKESLLFNTIIK